MSDTKVCKKQFLSEVTREAGMSLEDVSRAYDAILSVVERHVAKDERVSLTGFGTFYLQRHKGHPVQFEDNAVIPDYVVLKFSASDVVNKRLRAADGQKG